MNPETVQPEPSDQQAAEAPKVEVTEVEVTEVKNGGTKLSFPQTSSASSVNTQLQVYWERILAFLLSLTRFFGENRGPLGTFALVVLALITVKVIIALLDALNGIPLFKPTLEIIGVGYTGWFIYRYLLTATNRQELSEQIEVLKNRVLGTRS